MAVQQELHYDLIIYFGSVPSRTIAGLLSTRGFETRFIENNKPRVADLGDISDKRVLILGTNANEILDELECLTLVVMTYDPDARLGIIGFGRHKVISANHVRACLSGDATGDIFLKHLGKLERTDDGDAFLRGLTDRAFKTREPIGHLEEWVEDWINGEFPEGEHAETMLIARGHTVAEVMSGYAKEHVHYTAFDIYIGGLEVTTTFCSDTKHQYILKELASTEGSIGCTIRYARGTNCGSWITKVTFLCNDSDMWELFGDMIKKQGRAGGGYVIGATLNGMIAPDQIGDALFAPRV